MTPASGSLGAGSLRRLAVAESRKWRYYQYVSPANIFPPRYFREWRGRTERLDPANRAWVEVDSL